MYDEELERAAAVPGGPVDAPTVAATRASAARAALDKWMTDDSEEHDHYYHGLATRLLAGALDALVNG